MQTPRRGFLKSLAVAPLASAAVAPQAPPAPVPAPAPPPSAAPPPPTDHEAVAEALAEAGKREFGAHLDAAELGAVRKELQAGLERAQRLRQAARLSNADEPINRFEARPARSAAARSSSRWFPRSGSCASSRWLRPAWRRCAAGKSASCRSASLRCTTTGWRTSRIGASAASSGGGTASRPGPARAAKS